MAPAVSLSPSPAKLIVPLPDPPIDNVVTATVPPIVPEIVVLPVPAVIVKASDPLPFPVDPSIVPSIIRSPPFDPVLIVVVPSVLNSMFPASNVKSSSAVVIETSAPVILILALPATAS